MTSDVGFCLKSLDGMACVVNASLSAIITARNNAVLIAMGRHLIVLGLFIIVNEEY